MRAVVPETKLTNRRPLVFLSVVLLLAKEAVTSEKSRTTLLLRDREERNCPRKRERKEGGSRDWTITLPQQGNQLGSERGKHLCNLDGRPLPSHENYPRLLVQSISCQGSRAVAAAAAHRRTCLPPRPSWSLKHPWRLGRRLPHGGKHSSPNKNEVVWADWFSTRLRGWGWESLEFK